MSVATVRLTPPCKTHGGKSFLAKRIVELQPHHIHYVEAYGGGAAVLLAKDPEGISEVLNDLDGQLMNFWKVLQKENLFSAFVRKCEATPFSQTEWNQVHHFTGDDVACGLTDVEKVEYAHAFFVDCRQSMAGRKSNFAPISKNRIRRGMNEQASAWINAVDGLRDVHERLRRVVLLNDNAIKVIKAHDAVGTLFFIDAPYVHESRSTTTEYGEFEMTNLQHIELCDTLLACKGKVQLTTYHHPIYDILGTYGWKLKEFELPNNAASGDKKKRMTECLWMNYPSGS